MEQISPTCRHGQLKENDITLVLEQLQENGFSSFFDHPDCPFSSIQEVEDALKELEKEFRKIAVEQGAKTAAKKKTRNSSKSFLSSHPKLKPKVEQNKFREEFNPKFNTCSVPNKNDIMGKNKINPKFIWPRTRSAFSKDNGITVYPTKSDDSKNVYGVDSCGNKYSLKIEVFARVKLEPEDDIEASKNIITKSKVVLSPSKQKGLKSNEKVASFKPVLKTSKEQKETCVPLLLNYRSSMSIPCPSYMYPTACDRKKNCTPQVSKFGSKFRNNCGMTEKRDKKIDCKNDHFKVISQTESVDLRDNIVDSQNFNNICYQNIDIKPKLVADDHNYLSEKIINLSSEENNQDFNDLYPGNQSLKIQTSLENYERKDSIPYQAGVLKTQETSEILKEEQQTSCYENIQQISSIKEDENNSKEIASSADLFHNNMIEKEVGSKLLLLLDQTLINKLKGYEEMTNISYNEEKEDACDGKCSKGGSKDYPLSRRFDKSTNKLIKNIAYDAEPSNKYRTVSDPGEVNNILGKIYSCFNLEKVGVKSDLLPNCTAFNVNEQEKKDVGYLQTVSEVEAFRNIIKLDDRNCYENELSDSSSKETVIMNVSLDRDVAKELSIIRNESVLDVETPFDLQSNGLIDATSTCVYEEPLSSLSEDNSLPFYSADSEVGTYLEQIDIGKPLNVTLNECLNCNKLIENKISKFEEAVVSSVVSKKKFLDKGVGLSEKLCSTSWKLIMVDKEVRGTSIDSSDLKSKVIMVDKEIGPETTVERFKDFNRVDKKIGTIVEPNSMSTSVLDVLVRGSLGEIPSKQASKLKTNIDVIFEKENFDVVESKNNNFKFAKWSKAKPHIGQKLFKIPDCKSYESDKFMRILKERREKRKLKGFVKLEESSTRKHSRNKEDNDITYCCNTPSSTPSAQLDRLNKKNYRFKNETKFVKSVFAAKNMTSFRRPMYSNLDQKSTVNKLAKSRKMIGSFIASKNPNWHTSKPDYRGKLPRKQFPKEHSSGSTHFKIPENIVINVI